MAVGRAVANAASPAFPSPAKPRASASGRRWRSRDFSGATQPASPLAARADTPPQNRLAVASPPAGQARTTSRKTGMASCRAACTSRPRWPELTSSASIAPSPAITPGPDYFSRADPVYFSRAAKPILAQSREQALGQRDQARPIALAVPNVDETRLAVDIAGF